MNALLKMYDCADMRHFPGLDRNQACGEMLSFRLVGQLWLSSVGVGMNDDHSRRNRLSGQCDHCPDMPAAIRSFAQTVTVSDAHGRAEQVH